MLSNRAAAKRKVNRNAGSGGMKVERKHNYDIDFDDLIAKNAR